MEKICEKISGNLWKIGGKIGEKNGGKICEKLVEKSVKKIGGKNRW